MESLKVLEYINSHSDWEDILSSPPYNLIIKRDNPFVLIKYNQLSSDISNEIVQECRGLILKETNNKFTVASMRFKKFFNYGQSQASKLDFSEPVEVSQKIDGSLIGVWYDEETDWNVSTNGNINASKAEIQFQTNSLGTYRDLFDSVVPFKFDELNKNYTYIFELISPYNRIIVPYKETKLYLLAIRDNSTLKELPLKFVDKTANNLKVDRPKTFLCSNMKEIENAVGNLTEQDEHFEGFVLKDKHCNRIKLKSTKYMSLFFIKGDGVFSNKKILNLILDQQDDDVLGYFPEYTDDFNEVKRCLIAYLQAIRNELNVAIGKLSYDRKTFAKWAKNTINSDLMFKAYNNGGWNEDWLQKQIRLIPPEKLLVYIGLKCSNKKED